jgi:cell division protein FtsX
MINRRRSFLMATVISFSVLLCFCSGVKMAEEIAEKVEKTVKTTITLADRLWRDVKVYAARRGLKLTEVVEAALKEYVKENRQEPEEEKK